MSSRTLIVFDALALLYRAFYGIRNLSTRDGRPTNAVYGFIRMVDQIVGIYKPSHWVTFFDGGIPESRIKLLPEYKAHRPPMPDQLRSQIPLVEEYLTLMGMPWIRKEGVEADDAIASAACWACSEPGTEVLIASQDKDMFQLVCGNIKLVSLVADKELVDVEKIKLKTGVSPERIVDWLALTGDAVDNISGVPGVGAKTAAALIGKYPSMDSLLDGVESMENGKVKKSLEACKELIVRNMHLVRLDSGQGCPFTWDEMIVRSGDSVRKKAFYDKLEFKFTSASVQRFEQAALF